MSRYKSARSKSTNFSKQVKIDMLRRDKYRCIFCGTSEGLTPAHYISRASGGLGIIENGACVCVKCHQALDHSTNRESMLLTFKQYLNYHHPGFIDENRIFDRREWLK